jgi:hypothetical protein
MKNKKLLKIFSNLSPTKRAWTTTMLAKKQIGA